MGNLLGGKPQQKPSTQIDVQNILKKITQLNERTRLIEERLKQTRDKLQVLDETLSSKIKDLMDEISDSKGEISALRKELDEAKELLRRVVKELASTARLSDVKVLEKYINMIDITRFITREDVEEIVEEKLKKLKK
ncbi:MAG: hypothetical protein J7K73_03660 [Nanoarchaeota archaeon]|nr:hypothetical protein [Nanoarchaeota archaeon]